MLPEVKYYLEKLKEYEDICRGGKDFHDCSFMDISTRTERMIEAKSQAIMVLGKLELNKIEENQK